MTYFVRYLMNHNYHYQYKIHRVSYKQRHGTERYFPGRIHENYGGRENRYERFGALYDVHVRGRPLIQCVHSQSKF